MWGAGTAGFFTIVKNSYAETATRPRGIRRGPSGENLSAPGTLHDTGIRVRRSLARARESGRVAARYDAMQRLLRLRVGCMRPLDSFAICFGACAVFAGCMIVGFRAAPHLTATVITIPHGSESAGSDTGALGTVFSSCAAVPAPPVGETRDSSERTSRPTPNATYPLCRPNGSTTSSRSSSPPTGAR